MNKHSFDSSIRYIFISFFFFCIILLRLEIDTLYKPCKRYDSFKLIFSIQTQQPRFNYGHAFINYLSYIFVSFAS